MCARRYPWVSFRPPSEADIVAGEAQSLGVPMSYGGPHVGFLATREKYVRQMPGRLVGMGVDQRRPPGFRPDAGDARAAHPPREGDIQHLHQPVAVRPDGHDLSGHAWACAVCTKPCEQNIRKTDYAVTQIQSLKRHKVLFPSRASTNSSCNLRVAGRTSFDGSSEGTSFPASVCGATIRSLETLCWSVLQKRQRENRSTRSWRA